MEMASFAISKRCDVFQNGAQTLINVVWDDARFYRMRKITGINALLRGEGSWRSPSTLELVDPGDQAQVFWGDLQGLGE